MSAASHRVNPAEYDAFFLWAGVKPHAALKRAKTIYLLNGEVQVKDAARLVPLRPGTPQIRHARIWMTVRLERLDWDEAVYQHILQDMERWKGAGNDLIGLQLDFDARTRGLSDYAAFLRGVRQRLPQYYQLSVTGLMDWSAGGNSAALSKLGDVVDEVVIQTYQGRETIAGYERYMDSLRRLPMPYRIALVEGGEWRAPPALVNDPHFRGYVIFLLPPVRRAAG
ncbi:MAG: DUF3142 domain-containing protein [Sphingobium sp.]|nr:DUF3142 domain-containing protein [Sphingobium sp.]